MKHFLVLKCKFDALKFEDFFLLKQIESIDANLGKMLREILRKRERQAER